MAERFSFAGVDSERTARAALTFVAPTEDLATWHVLRLTGSAVATLEVALRDEPIAGLSRTQALLWRRRFDTANLDQIAEGLEQARSLELQLLMPDDPAWPDSLSVLGSRTPHALWAKGDTSLLAAPASSRAAIDGANPSSDYGAGWTIRVAAELTQDGYVIAAPRSSGIASDAVKGALLEGGHPIVVAPHPLTPLYMTDSAVARDGLLVSEFPPGFRNIPAMRRQSDRILAATSGVFTVVEAWENSPPMETARLASSLEREVAALPGDVTRATRGTNLLIAERTATLVTDTEDIIRILEKGKPPSLSPFAIDIPTTSRVQDQTHGLGR